MDRTRLLGYSFGILTAASWATSPILIRKGLEGLPSSLWGVTVGLASATSLYLIWLLMRNRALRRRDGEKILAASPAWKWDRAMKTALFIQSLAGFAAGLGTIGRTFSIEFAPIVIAIPLAQTTSLFTLIFAPLLLGSKVEHVNLKLVLGALLIVLGSALVVIGRNS